MDSNVVQPGESSVAEQLDEEIAKLRAQVESLRKDLKLHTSTLLSAPSARDIVVPGGGPQPPSKARAAARPPPASETAAADRLLARADDHDAHKQRCLYRAAASVTSFRVRDPDPNSVDRGSILALRFDVMSRARFLRPYYVMLNRPFPTSPDRLRVHRHTVPPCIPLAGLAARHLPPPRKTDDGGGGGGAPAQDLSRFARALRREIVRYHNRAGAISDLRRAAGVGSSRQQQQDGGGAIVDVGAADAEAKQVRVEWADGRTGRLVMSDDGRVLRMVVQGGAGRDRASAREFLGGAERIEQIAQRLAKG